MSGQPAFASVLMLVACTMPPQQEEPIVLPVVVVEEPAPKRETPKEVPKPQPKPKLETKQTEQRKADSLCPPAEGETEQQRILRKLDCLLERD